MLQVYDTAQIVDQILKEYDMYMNCSFILMTLGYPNLMVALG